MRKHRAEKAWGVIAAVATSATLALTMACSDRSGEELNRSAAARQRQGTQTDGEATLGTRSVTGTVMNVVDNGIVVIGRENGGNEREWAFVVEPGTRIDKNGKLMEPGTLREGDLVTVLYTNRDGKIVARSVTSAPSEIPASTNR